MGVLDVHMAREPCYPPWLSNLKKKRIRAPLLIRPTLAVVGQPCRLHCLQCLVRCISEIPSHYAFSWTINYPRQPIFRHLLVAQLGASHFTHNSYLWGSGYTSVTFASDLAKKAVVGGYNILIPLHWLLISLVKEASLNRCEYTVKRNNTVWYNVLKLFCILSYALSVLRFFCPRGCLECGDWDATGYRRGRHLDMLMLPRQT